MGLDHRLQFVKEYLCNPTVVGAVGPSSQALARALCEPYLRRQSSRPATVLEVGAGTGAVTRYLGMILGDGDRLDVCEKNARFADILERDVLTSAAFAPAMASGRVRLLRAPVQDLGCRHRYDFVISCLPLTVFELHDVQEVFEVIERSLKPGGTLSYFEYAGFRGTTRLLSLGRQRERIRSVSAYLTSRIRCHQYDRKLVLQNIPPAYARHLRFDGQRSAPSTRSVRVSVRSVS